MMGAAIATVAAYSTMAIGDGLVVAAHLPRSVPVAARRDGDASARSASPRSWKAPGGGLLAAIALTPVYPLVLLALGFANPGERRRLHSLR